MVGAYNHTDPVDGRRYRLLAHGRREYETEPMSPDTTGRAGREQAAASTVRDRMLSFASSTQVVGARIRLDLTEVPFIGSSTLDAETTRAIGALVLASLRAEPLAEAARAKVRGEPAEAWDGSRFYDDAY